MIRLPETGYLRLSNVLGVKEITEEQAAENRRRNARAAAEAVKKGRVNRNGDPIYARRPTRPRRAVPAIVPVSHSGWWDGVKKGRYPKPIKLGPRTTVWRVEDILALLADAASEHDSERAA